MRLLSLALIALSASLCLTLASLVKAKAQSEVQIVSPQVEYEFGEKILFRATIQSEIPVAEVLLFMQSEGQPDIEFGPAMVDDQGNVVGQYDLKQYPLVAFSNTSYWYKVKLEDGRIQESQRFEFFYEDNRFNWQSLNEDNFQLYWYDGNLAFAQEVLNVARAGLERVESYLPAIPDSSVKIYVYKSAQEMQAALRISGQNWVVGHATPDLGMILVSLPPGPEQRLEMERQIPHELMHVMLYRTTGPAYKDLPVWFNEGLASISELYPNPDYLILLDNAYQNGSLLPITSLCQTFPRDASGVQLAYAQSNSFMRYVYNQYEKPGLENLQAQYASGVNCERGPENALGVSLNRLESQWRRDTFAEVAWLHSLEQLLPWLILLLAGLASPTFLIFRNLTRLSPSEGPNP